MYSGSCHVTHPSFPSPFHQDIAEANFRTSSSRLLAAVMSALCNTSVKLTSILPIAYDGEVLLRSLVKQVSTENDSALAHRFPLLVAHMEKLSHVSESEISTQCVTNEDLYSKSISQVGVLV